MSKLDAKRALLTGIVDYAGTFPPAALSLPDALKRAATYRAEGRHPWLMSKVVLPIADTLSLTAGDLMAKGADGSPWLLTVLLNDQQPLKEQLSQLGQFNREQEQDLFRLEVVSVETKTLLGALEQDDGETLENRVSQVCLDCEAVPFIQPYFEVAFFGDGETQVTRVLNLLSQNSRGWLKPGVKVRTGGPTKASPTQLAFLIAESAKRRLRFKSTQGLHAPISHDDSFGFVNLFAALAFAYARQWEPALVNDCLVDTRRENFSLSGGGLNWKDQEISVEEVVAARKIHMGCFGSCSIDEPDEFLETSFTDE